MIVETTKLKCPFGSLGWINYFGIPIFLIAYSIIVAFKAFSQSYRITSILPTENYSVVVLSIGIALYYYQLKKLRFKSIKLNTTTDKFKANALRILSEEGWEIDCNNKSYLQAIHRKRITSFPLITIRFYRKEIRWNLVYHPESKNIGAIGALLSPNTYGKKTLKKILASA